MIGSALGGAPAKRAAPTETAPAAAPSWDDRQVILGRNLFNASLLAPAGGAEIEEDLEATRLPLTLLGTVSALEPENAWAAIEERDTHVTRIVKVNDELRPGVDGAADRAAAGRPDRERIPARARARRGRGHAWHRPDRRRGRPAQVRPAPRADSRGATPRPGGRPAGAPGSPTSDPDNLRNPATLFSQARILPKYEDGQMVGVQVNAIKPGSLFERSGSRTAT